MPRCSVPGQFGLKTMADRIAPLVSIAALPRGLRDAPALG